ncbi:Spy/CpxP family protein refolding chaperone [Psychromonas sp. MME2]|uniref:Spy/CpxP family protein refolding chaperone n=1 Tax=unclassified Psychromonas TaxID=2614957 RepID=UPI00339CB2CF
MNALLKNMLVATIVLPLTFSTAFAKQEGRGGACDAMPMQSMLAKLDLTDAQKADVKTIMQKHKSDKQQQKGAFHDAQMSIMKAPKFDAAQAEALIDSKDAAKKARKMQRMEMMFDVYHLLTPQQQTKMDKLLANKKGKHSHKGKKCKQGKNNDMQGKGKGQNGKKGNMADE